MPRARGIQIYLKEGIEEDDILLTLWEICKTQSRPQEVFRRMLQKGLREMIKSKDLSDSLIQELTERLNYDLEPQTETEGDEDQEEIITPKVKTQAQPRQQKKPETQQVKQATSPVDEIIKTQEPKIETPRKPKEPKQNFNHQQGLVSKNLM